MQSEIKGQKQKTKKEIEEFNTEKSKELKTRITFLKEMNIIFNGLDDNKEEKKKINRKVY